jgi:hypothetical protein
MGLPWSKEKIIRQNNDVEKKQVFVEWKRLVCLSTLLFCLINK